MAELYRTKPEYVDAVGGLAQFQKERLVDYATQLGNSLFESYEKMQQIRTLEYAHVQTSHSFNSMPSNETINFVYDIWGDPSTKTIRFIEVFIQIASWTYLKFQIKRDDSSDNANGTEESVQGELPVHDESSDQGI